MEGKAGGAVGNVLHLDPYTAGSLIGNIDQRIHCVVHGAVEEFRRHLQLLNGILGPAADTHMDLHQVGFLEHVADLEHVQGAEHLFAGGNQADGLVGHALGDVQGHLSVLVGDLAGDGLDLAGDHVHSSQLGPLNGSVRAAIRAVSGVVAHDHQIQVRIGKEGLAAQGLAVGGIQPDIPVQVVGGILAYAEEDVVPIRHFRLVDHQALAVRTGSLLSVDQDGQIGGLLAHVLGDPVGGPQGQEVLGALGGKLIEVDQLVSQDQHVQGGHAAHHLIGVAVAFGQVAGNLLIEAEDDLLTTLLEVEGHRGVAHARLGDGHLRQGHKGIGAVGSQIDRLPQPTGGNGDGALAVGAGGAQGGLQGSVLGIHQINLGTGDGAVGAAIEGLAHDGQGNLLSGLQSLAVQGLAVPIGQIGVLVLTGGLVDAEHDIIAVHNLGLVDGGVAGHGAVDQNGDPGGRLAEHLVDPAAGSNHQIIGGTRLGEILTEAVNMGLDQHVQSGHAGLGIHVVGKAVALCQIAPDLGIYAEGDKIPFRLSGVGHGGRNELGGGDGDHAVGGGERRLYGDGFFAIAAGPVGDLGLDAAGGGHDVGTGLLKGHFHIALAVGDRILDGGEGAVLPGADLGTGHAAGLVAAHSHGRAALEIQGDVLVGLHGESSAVKVADHIRPVGLILENAGIELVALGHGAGLVGHTHGQSHIVLQEVVASLGICGDVPDLLDETAADLIAALTVLLMQGNQSLIVGQDAVAVQVLDGDGQLDSGLAVGSLGEDTLVAEGKVNRSTVSRAGLGGLLYGDNAVGGDGGTVDVVRPLQLIIPALAGQNALGGDKVGTGLVEAQGHIAVKVGLGTADLGEDAVLPGAHGDVGGTGLGVVVGLTGQGQLEGLTGLDRDLGLVEPGEAVGPVRLVRHDNGIQLIVVCYGAGLVGDHLGELFPVLEKAGGVGLNAPELGNGNTPLKGVAAHAVDLMQSNQCVVEGQDAVGIRVLDGDGQLHGSPAVVGLAQDSLHADGKEDIGCSGICLEVLDLLHRLFGGLLVSRLGLIRGFRFLRGFRGFLGGSLRLFLCGGFRFFLGSLCLDCGILGFHCGN